MNVNTLDFSTLKVANYNRKSSEAEDRQVLSVQSQIDEAARIKQFYGLPNFMVVFKESKSAKTEFTRKEFSTMMDMINAGKIDAVVCWKLDRLARNMTEGGQLIDKLSSGKIKAIITHDKVYYPTDNVLLMAVEFGQNKQFVKDLSVSVKRGQLKKAEMGYPHGAAALGFLNDRTEEKGNRKWLVDSDRLEKIKILFDKFLSGTYSAGKLHQYAVTELKLTTVKRRKTGGKLIVISRIYEILKDPIYAGFFIYGGTRYELGNALPRVITEDQHEQVKKMLQKNNIPKVQTHNTTFSGFISSDEGNFVGQDVKYQVICDCKKKFAYRSKTHCPSCGTEIAQMNNPKYLHYVFYYNVKKKKAKQGYKCVSETAVSDKIIDFVDNNLTFSEDLVAWSKSNLEELKVKELNEVLFQKRIEEQSKIDFDQKKTRLRSMLRDQQITDVEYKSDLEALEKQYGGLYEDKKTIDWYSKLNNIIDLTSRMKIVLEHGTIEAKREVLSKLGTNLIWNEEKLSVHNTLAIDKLIEGVNKLKSISSRYEPKNYVEYKGKKEKTPALADVNSIWLGSWDSNPGPIG